MAKFRLGLQVSPFQAHYITGEKASGLGNVLVGPAGVDHEPIHATMQQLTTTNTIPLAQPSPAQQEVEVQDVSSSFLASFPLQKIGQSVGSPVRQAGVSIHQQRVWRYSGRASVRG